MDSELHIILDNANSDNLLYGGDRRLYKVEWKGRPQPVEIYIHECREVKDKLQYGQYSIKICIKDRIGGQILFYNKADSL